MVRSLDANPGFCRLFRIESLFKNRRLMKLRAYWHLILDFKKVQILACALILAPLSQSVPATFEAADSTHSAQNTSEKADLARIDRIENGLLTRG